VTDAQPSRWANALVVLGGMALVLVVGTSFGGELSTFASAGVLYVPAIVLAVLLQLSEFPTARIASWVWFWGLIVGMAGTVIGVTYIALLPRGAASTPSPATLATTAVPVQLIVVMLVLVLAGVLLAATSAWVPVVERLGACVDRTNPAHAQAAVGVLVLSAMAIAPLGVLGGRAPLVEMLNSLDMNSPTLGYVAQLLAQVYSALWIGVFVLLGAAWPARSSLRGAAARLGIGPLKRSDLLPLTGATVLAVLVGIGLDLLNRVLLGWLGWPMTDPAVVTRLVPAATTPVGALVVALCAGISEELLFRGLLQPRLGWLLANVAFAAAHAFQYGVDGVVAVFVLGAILASVRQHWNTTAAIGVHVAYDALLFLLAAFGF
jgi:membrane protease YdiL (CAAX protease family)